MALGAFKQGDAFLASIDRELLTVPMHRDLAQVPRYGHGILVEWLRKRRILVRVNLG